MPGAAACAVDVSSNASTSKPSNRVFEIMIFLFVAFIAALLIDMDLGHEPAKILSVVGQVVEIRGVEVIDTCRYRRRARCPRYMTRVRASVQNDVERLAAAERDRVRVVVHVVPRLIAQELGVEANHGHGNSERGQR